MIYDQDPSRYRSGKINGKVEKTGEVCLDDEKICRMGFQQRPNHQIQAAEGLQSEIPSIGGRVRLPLAPIRMLSGKIWFNGLQTDGNGFANNFRLLSYRF